MALYDGFFDAVFNEETGKFDREYESGAFTRYFGSFVGSGVCVYQNPDSMLVRLEDGAAVVQPGYLFIQGYWLKNDAAYTVDYAGEGPYAVLAQLDMARRMITLTAGPKASPESYPDALALAYVEDGAVTDTRYRTDICGVIDAAGSLTGKIEFALHYIDTEIEDKLAQAEADIRAQEAELDAKIAGVQALVDKLTPPPVGTIQFSASQDVGPEWLRCDGRFVSETDYPELVAALGKLTPSGDKFKLLSSGEIGPQLSNGALYAGRLWVYSYSAKKLYGVDVEGGQPVKEISLSSSNAHFGDFIAPTVLKPICLSIVPHKKGSGAKLFLAQIVQDGGKMEAFSSPEEWLPYFLFFSGEFQGTENSVVLDVPFQGIPDAYNQGASVPYAFYYFNSKASIPYVSSRIVNGKEIYSVYAGDYSKTLHYDVCVMEWESGQDIVSVAVPNVSTAMNMGTGVYHVQRTGFSRKNKDEVVGIFLEHYAVANIREKRYQIHSYPNQTFSMRGFYTIEIPEIRKSYGPVDVIGNSVLAFAFDLNSFLYASLQKSEARAVNPNIQLPSAARVFVDAGAYLWGKDIYFFFVGTGILFSRTLQEGDWGYLDTTSVLGTITQFGYLDYSEDEGTLYILGQDSSNRVKAAKIVLNTLYDYANDGAWLPVIASDGVPAYIKAYQPEEAET